MKLTSRKPAEAAPARMGALAKLPIFLDLDGKRALVSGGTAPAAWKAELLAAAGAHVEIYATELSQEMTALLTRGATSGQFTHIPRKWTPRCIGGAAIAVADIECELEATAFNSAARAAGVPVNVIDKPQFCQFQFGAIVNRSPVVVAISTDGAAPILGQAIRRRIETLLPPSLASWAALAKSIRNQVSHRLPAVSQRRAFWEKLSEQAFQRAPAINEASDAATLIDQLAGSDHKLPQGRVTLVGAGPGDAEHLTLKAVRALQSADVILYDDLVSDDVLELARREAKRMMVGKRGGRDSCTQEDINQLIEKLARQGKHVVRLKCGDPMIFGRAGEEIETLRSAGIEVSVVPGITTASAMAASLGISLTRRGKAQSVRFMTGHARSGELPEDCDWRGMADPATTLVVYMGGRTAPMLAARLIEHGLCGTTPVVGVSDVGRPGERRHDTSLSCLASNGMQGWDGVSPILLGIGRVFEQFEQQRLTAPDVADHPVRLPA